MLGGPVIGRRCNRIGIGFLPITSTRRSATCSSMAIGITRSAVAACCLRRCISVQASYARPGFSYSPAVGHRPGSVRRLSLLAAAIPALLLRRLLRRELPDRGILPLLFVQLRRLSAMIRFTLTSAGSIARTASGSTASQPTSRTAAITRMPDRRARGRLKDAFGAGAVGSKEQEPCVGRATRSVRKEPKQSVAIPAGQSGGEKNAGQRGQEVQRFGAERQKLETRVAAPSAASLGKGLAPAKVTLPRSPMVARPIAELDKGHAPPQMHAAPKPDLKVEPKPQATRSPEQPQAQPRRASAAQSQPQAERPAQPQPRVEHAAPPPQPRSSMPLRRLSPGRARGPATGATSGSATGGGATSSGTEPGQTKGPR